MKQFEFITEAQDIGQRLDKYLAENISKHSRNYIQTLIRAGKVTINGRPIKSNHRLKQGERILVEVPPLPKLELIPEKIYLDIIYQDNDIAVINKPQGMVVHPAAGNYSGTLVNALLYYFDSLSTINSEFRPGIVHRIDKDTSGLLVVAKNDFSHLCLTEQIQNRELVRIYHAITEDNWKEDGGTISAPIGRSSADRKKMAVVEGGRQAITHYRILERFGSHTYLELKLETGRTHQIRVHLSYKKRPIIGDQVYGRRKQMFNLKGQALHAVKLKLVHPRTKELMTFRAPLPKYFEKLLELLRKN